MPRTNLSNALDISLASALVAGAVTMDVIGATDIPAAPFYVVVDPFSTTLREYMLCTSVSGTGDARTLTVTRNEDGSIGDVDHAAGNLVRFATVSQHVSDLWDQVELTQAERVRWQTPYDPSAHTYEKNDMVLDGPWTMIANQQTDERAAPQPIGPIFEVYGGPVVTDNPTVTQIIHGQTYSFSSGAYLTGYRLYTVTGNIYSVFVATGAGDFVQILTLTAGTTGWVSFPLAAVPIFSGSEFSLLSVVQEPDPTPTTFVGNWNYQAPNNEILPAAGQIVHATRNIAQLWISKTDNNSGDRGAELLGLEGGDIIDGAGVRWAIQASVDEGFYVAYQVSPAIQGSPLGVQEFTFETTTATPITHQHNTDYWLANQPTQGLIVKGLFTDSGGFDDLVEDDTAYGVDIDVQEASVSTHWNVVAFSG